MACHAESAPSEMKLRCKIQLYSGIEPKTKVRNTVDQSRGTAEAFDVKKSILSIMNHGLRTAIQHRTIVEGLSRSPRQKQVVQPKGEIW